MRSWIFCTAAAVCVSAPARAGTDHLLFGPPESWIVPVTAPAPPASNDSTAFTNLLDDEQAMLGKGERRFYSGSVYRINSPEGLDNGNINIIWDPATDSVTVHKLLIRRDDQVIDVLKSGQTFTVMRRETNLEAGMLDGRLTATLLPEGLQVGDIVELAVTYVHKDPTTKDSTETELATFNGSPIERGFARLTWPSSLPVSFQTTGGLPSPKIVRANGMSSIEYDMRKIEPLVLPAAAPARFRQTRAVEASSFRNWDEVAAVMAPYFESAAVIPPSGPLRDEVQKIKALPGSDTVRAEAALRLVENSVRYVALSMGTGGYVPASAEVTWARRFGDCKAKTALLMAILRELHVKAEPVLANTDGADGLDRNQPQLGWFNHVLVRAHVDGKDYWLDGTRSGDTKLDLLETPAYDWGLPLVANAALVRMVPAPLREPTVEVAMDIDARDGIHVKAPITLTYKFRGDLGLQASQKYNQTAPSQRDHKVREFFKQVADDWKGSIVSLEPDKVTAVYDPQRGEMNYTFNGMATLDWSDSSFYVQFASLAFKPNFARTEGVNREAPIAIDYPYFGRLKETIRLPADFQVSSIKLPDIDTTVVGTHYHRHVATSGDTFSVEVSEQAIASEVPYAEAMSSSAALRDLYSKQISINVPDDYTPSDKDMAAWMAEKLAGAGQFINRGNALLDKQRYDEAIADFSNAIALDKTQGLAYSDRAIAYISKGKTDLGRADLEAAAAINPKDAVMLRGRGILAEQTGKWQDAVNAYTASLAVEPGNNFAIGHRGMDLAAMDKDDQALSDIAMALDRNPKWIGLRVVRAAVYAKRHQCDEAIKDAGALASGSQDPDSTYAAASIYVRCDRRADGFALLDKSLAAKPSAQVYVQRARLRPLTDRSGRISDLDAAIKLEPSSPAWLSFKADEMDRVGDRKGALQAYDQALKLKPDDFMLALNRAVVIYRLGRTAEATKLLTELRSRAKEAVLLNNLCWAKATAGIMLESALSDCQQALKLQPDYAGYLDSLGMTLLKLGRYDEAITAYGKAIAGGTGAISLLGRSIAYAHTGKPDLAAADKKAALADDQDIGSRAERYNLSF